jgi:hypothetical protein
MPRVKITNLKPGPIVVNSLKITIPGGASVIRDASVVGDSDLSELEADGLVKIEDAGETPKPTKPAYTVPEAPKATAKTPKQAGQKSQKPQQATPKQAQGIANRGKQVVSQGPKQKPGTDFRNVDPPDENMVVVMGKNGTEFRKVGEEASDKVVVMGDDGPAVRKMGRGINERSGPKYEGDTGFEGQDVAQDDVELPDNSDIHAV